MSTHIMTDSPQVSPAAQSPAAEDLDPQVVPGNTLFGNRYSRAYKLQILEAADACTQPGELGQLLRQAGLTHTTLTAFRKQRAAGTLQTPPCPKSKPNPAPDPEITRRVMELERENRRLKRQLQQAEAVIDIQKKVARLLEISLDPSGD